MTVARVARRYMSLTGCSIHQTAYDLTTVRRRVVSAEALWYAICALVAEESKLGACPSVVSAVAARPDDIEFARLDVDELVEAGAPAPPGRPDATA